MGSGRVVANYGLFTVDDDAFRRAARNLDAEWRRSASQYVSSAIRRSADVVQASVKAEARRHRKTGRMESNIQQRKSGQGMGIVVRVVAGGSIAPLIIRGVKPHREVGHMRFEGSTGLVTFSRTVEHPGFPGDPFFARGVRRARPGVKAILDRTTARMAASLAARIGGK